MEIQQFSVIEGDFIQRVQTMIWCNMATVDTQGRPRSRIVHPVWEGGIGWITTRRGSHKGKHLSANPHVSLAYIADLAKPVYADCIAAWVDDPAEKRRVWEFIKHVPPPVGFDPATLFKEGLEDPGYGLLRLTQKLLLLLRQCHFMLEDPGYGLLRLTPWRVELVNLPDGKPQVWHRASE